jgi:hypothetical protein
VAFIESNVAKKLGRSKKHHELHHFSVQKFLVGVCSFISKNILLIIKYLGKYFRETWGFSAGLGTWYQGSNWVSGYRYAGFLREIL